MITFSLSECQDIILPAWPNRHKFTQQNPNPLLSLNLTLMRRKSSDDQSQHSHVSGSLVGFSSTFHSEIFISSFIFPDTYSRESSPFVFGFEFGAGLESRLEATAAATAGKLQLGVQLRVSAGSAQQSAAVSGHLLSSQLKTKIPHFSSSFIITLIHVASRDYHFILNNLTRKWRPKSKLTG